MTRRQMLVDKASAQLWSRLDDLLVVHAPTLLASLRPPATQSAINFAQTMLGVKFPEEIRSAYLCHDGSRVESGSCFFPPFNQFASLEVMVSAWQLRQKIAVDTDATEPYAITNPSMLVQPVWWDEKWLPIGTSNSMTIISADLNPGPSGRYGQLLCDNGMGESTPFSSGLNSYLEDMVCRIEGNLIGYKDDGWYWIKTGLHILDWNNPDSAY
jgi:cell wall assembly regulator SMI1